MVRVVVRWCLVATLVAASRLEVSDIADVDVQVLGGTAQAVLATQVAVSSHQSSNEGAEGSFNADFNVVSAAARDPISAGIDAAKSAFETAVRYDDAPWEAAASAVKSTAALAVFIPAPNGLVLSGVLGLMAWGMETLNDADADAEQSAFESHVTNELAQVKDELKALRTDFSAQLSSLRQDIAEQFSHFSLHVNTLEQIMDFLSLLEDYRTSKTKRKLLPKKAEEFVTKFEVERHGSGAMGPANVHRALEFYDDTCKFFSFFSKVLTARNILAYAMILDAPNRSPEMLKVAVEEVLANLEKDMAAYDRSIALKLGAKEPHVRRAWMSKNCVLADTLLKHHFVRNMEGGLAKLSYQRFSRMAEEDTRWKENDNFYGTVHSLHFYGEQAYLVHTDPYCGGGYPKMKNVDCSKRYYWGPAAGLLTLGDHKDHKVFQQENSVLCHLPDQSAVGGDFLYFLPPATELVGNEVIHRCRLPDLLESECEELDMGVPKIGRIQSMAITQKTLFAVMGSFLARVPLLEENLEKKRGKEGRGAEGPEKTGWAHVPRSEGDPHCKKIHIFGSSLLCIGSESESDSKSEYTYLWAAPLTGFLRPDVPTSEWMEEGNSSPHGGIQWLQVTAGVDPRSHTGLNDAWFLSG